MRLVQRELKAAGAGVDMWRPAALVKLIDRGLELVHDSAAGQAQVAFHQRLSSAQRVQ